MDKLNNLNYLDILEWHNLRDNIELVKNESFVFTNNLNENIPIPPKERYGIEMENFIIDKNHKYKKNKYGFRDKDFENVTDFLFAGCSQTFGVGIPEEAIWGNLIANKLNLDPANISTPGAGVDYIINTIFAYFKNFGHPKYLLCLFPDFTRMEIPINTKRITYNNSPYKSKKTTLSLDIINFNSNDEIDKIMKAPYNIEKILAEDFFYMISIKKILILEQYCNMAGIKLLWGTWDGKANNICQILQHKYKNFSNFINLLREDIHIVTNSMNARKYVKEYDKDKYDSLNSKGQDDMFKKLSNYCHKDLEKKYSHCFEVGQDDMSEFGLFTNRHYGVHAHAHFADKFYQNLMI
jgi:hypothetical protein